MQTQKAQTWIIFFFTGLCLVLSSDMVWSKHVSHEGTPRVNGTDQINTNTTLSAITARNVISFPQVQYKAGEVLVKFRKGTGRYQAADVISQKDMSVSRHYKALAGLDRGRYALVQSRASTLQMIHKLKQNPKVEAVSPNYIRHMANTPDDPEYPLWGLRQVNAPEAWETATGSSNVVVAVIDSGVDYTHQDLENNMWNNTQESLDDVHGINAVADNGAPMDTNGHGTHTAGTIGAVGDNQELITGVNWGVQIMALKFLNAQGYGTIGDALECLDYVIQQKEDGENIVAINASWGGGGHSQIMKDAISEAGDLGIIFCAAAGNGGSDNVGDNNDLYPHYPSSYDLDNIIAVAASDENDDLAGFSNYGSASVDLAAPGVSVLSTVLGGGHQPQSDEIFFEDMESGAGNWTAEGDWAITEEKKASCPSGNHTWSDSPNGDYDNYTNASLIAPQIDLSGRSGEQLTLSSWLMYTIQAYQAYNDSGDRLFLEISQDNGTSWTTLETFTGDSDAWSYVNRYLPENYKTGEFRFRFRLKTDDSETRDGIYIDDVGLGVGKGSNATARYAGTSMATPHVTGAVALMAAAYPDENMLTRKHRVLAGVEHVQDLEGKVFQEGRLDLSDSISTAPEACSHSISPTGKSFNSSGGNQEVSIDGKYSDCDWEASHSLSWASLAPTNGEGDGSLTITVDSNSGSSREGTVSIAGNSFEITQAGVSCSYTISPTHASFGATGGEQGVSIDASHSTCDWSVSNSLSWVHVSSTSNSGDGSTTISIEENTGSSQRNGSISIAENNFDITQNASSDSDGGGGGGCIHNPRAGFPISTSIMLSLVFSIYIFSRMHFLKYNNKD